MPNAREAIGDNSVDAEALQGLIDRIEKLEEEKQDITDDIGEVFKEAKGSGFDVKTLRKVLQLRKMEKALRDAEAEMMQAYCRALGM